MDEKQDFCSMFVVKSKTFKFCSNILGAKQDFRSKMHAGCKARTLFEKFAVEDFWSNILGAMQDFCSNMLGMKQDFYTNI